MKERKEREWVIKVNAVSLLMLSVFSILAIIGFFCVLNAILTADIEIPDSKEPVLYTNNELADLECKRLGYTYGTEISYGLLGSEIRCFTIKNGVQLKNNEFRVNWNELRKSIEKRD